MTRGRRITAVRLLRTLGTIEHLSAVGNDSEVKRLLAGVDPIECQELADELDAENTDRRGVRGLRVVEISGDSIVLEPAS